MGLSQRHTPTPEIPQVRQAVPVCPSGFSPSEAHGPEPPFKDPLNPFLLDLPGLPNPVLGAALVQREHLLLIPYFSHIGDYLFSIYQSWVWLGSRKDWRFGHHLPKKGLLHLFLYVCAGAL